MRVISYNLRKHRAATELTALANRYEPDVLCLQECDTADMPASIGTLRLAEATSRNRLGLAVYYRENTFHLKEVRSMALKKSMHDRVLKPAEERMLGVRLHDIDENRELIVASFHAAPLTALNSLRRHQIRTALTELQGLGEGLPVLTSDVALAPAASGGHGRCVPLRGLHNRGRVRPFRCRRWHRAGRRSPRRP